jgi:hypothetical protein
MSVNSLWARGKVPSTLHLSEWQEVERNNAGATAVTPDGSLLDNLTLELRVHPPEVNIDNTSDAKATLVTVDSANRPGTLVFVSSNSRRRPTPGPARLLTNHPLLQVVQHFTELGLRIRNARISSDGGWFHDSEYAHPCHPSLVCMARALSPSRSSPSCSLLHM